MHPQKVSAERGVLMYYTKYSFIGLVKGKPMEFVSEEEYLEYITDANE